MNSVLLAVSVGLLAQHDPTPQYDLRPSVTNSSAAVAVPSATFGNVLAANSRPSQVECCSTSAAGMTGGNQLWLKPTGDLIQHQYPTTLRTYYYFRPYSHTRLSAQKKTVVSDNTNARLPYSNAMFREVYEAVEPQFPPRQE